jgi:CRISPR-associated endonuclease/helicase Cas3
VNDAQETWRALKNANQEGGPEVALFHSRFPFFRREKIESVWLSRLGKNSDDRPDGCILVSTQVAEQSVDIDADLLITDLAPTDMLLQRIGRLWRHDKASRPCFRPEVWLQMPQLSGSNLLNISVEDLCLAFGKSARVYAPYVLLRSFQQWIERDNITLPDDIRSIIEATYADPVGAEPPAWLELRKKLEKQKETMARQALSVSAIFSNPALEDEEGVQTRYGSYPMVSLLLLSKISSISSHSFRLECLEGEIAVVMNRGWDFEVAKAIHRNLVRVPFWAVSAFMADSPAWLSNYCHHAAVIGVVRQENGCIYSTTGTEMGLTYHEDEGVRIYRECIQKVRVEDECFD